MNFPPRVNSGKNIFRLKIKWEINKFLHDFQHLYPSRKIPLCPSYPTMIHELVFSVGGKKGFPPPTPLHLGICTIHRLTDQSVAWLIDCIRRVGVNDLNHSCTQRPFVFTGRRNYWCQNQFIISFTHRAGGGFWIHLKFSQFADTQLPRTSFSYFTCHHYLTDKEFR